MAYYTASIYAVFNWDPYNKQINNEEAQKTLDGVQNTFT